jgi:hypothetical protein
MEQTIFGRPVLTTSGGRSVFGIQQKPAEVELNTRLPMLAVFIVRPSEQVRVALKESLSGGCSLFLQSLTVD